jgi:hypothetical protein
LQQPQELLPEYFCPFCGRSAGHEAQAAASVCCGEAHSDQRWDYKDMPTDELSHAYMIHSCSTQELNYKDYFTRQDREWLVKALAEQARMATELARRQRGY